MASNVSNLVPPKRVRSTENLVTAIALINQPEHSSLGLGSELGYCRTPVGQEIIVQDAKRQLMEMGALAPIDPSASFATVRTEGTDLLSVWSDWRVPVSAVAAVSASVSPATSGAARPGPGAAAPTRPKPSMAVDTIKQLWSLRGPVITILALLIFLPLALSEHREARCGYVVLVMAVMWLTEAIPIPATALLPIFMFPMVNVETAKNVSKNYVNDTSMLFMGGLIVAVAVEEWRLHKRIAVGVLRIVGSDPKFVMLGLMLPTWFLSMWISNTATAAMMIPIAHAVMQQMGTCRKGNRDSHEMKNVNTNADDKSNEKYTYYGDSVDGHRPSDVQMQQTEKTDLQAKLPAGEIMLDVPITQPEVIFPVPTPTAVAAKTAEGDDAEESEEDAEFVLLCKGLCLCIAYGCNIGGIATLTGTPPNLVLKGVADDLFNDRYKELNLDQEGSGITFGNWMAMALPLSALALFLAWIMLMVLFLRGNICRRIPWAQKRGVRAAIMQEWKNLGPFTMAELEITILFVILAVLWISRDPKTSPGWSVLFAKGYVSDSAAVMVIVILLFLLPAHVPRVFCLRKPEHEKAPYYRPLLTWEQVHRKLPWGVIFLLGGGFALAKACQESGLSKWLGDELHGLSSMDTWLLNLILCIIVAMATEVTSNTATATLLMPIMANIALSVQVNPLYLMISAGIATSFAFMLPVATPPNAIVFSYGSLRVFDMALAGIFMNIVALGVLMLFVNSLTTYFYDLDTLPYIFSNATKTH